MREYTVNGGSLQCECGRLYHVSVFHDVLRVIAHRAYQLGRHTAESAVDEAIETGYEHGRAAEGFPR